MISLPTITWLEELQEGYKIDNQAQELIAKEKNGELCYSYDEFIKCMSLYKKGCM